MLYTDAIYLILALVLFSGWPTENHIAFKDVFTPFLLKEGLFVGLVFLKLKLSRHPREFLRAQSLLKLLAFISFTADVIGLSIPSLLEGQNGFLKDLAGLGLFLHYFVIIWFFSALYESRGIFANLSPRKYVLANLKLLLPFLIPWFLVNLALLGLDRYLPFEGLEKEIFYFALFLGALIFLMAPIAVRTWGCHPLPPSNLKRLILAYLEKEKTKLNEVYVWETFEGRLLTAGIIGVLPKFRYLLLSTGLLAALEETEILSVVAHEVGHLKHRHMAWLLLFFVLFSALVYLAFYPAFMALIAYFPFPEYFARLENLFVPEAFFTLGLLLAVIFYFRLLLGFFLRNFERQADLYCLESLGTAEGLIRSFKKIAALSGHTEDLPSWHHFSIKERIEFLKEAQTNPHLALKHHRKLRFWLALYVTSTLLLLGLFWRFPVEQLEKRAKLNLLYGTLLKEYKVLPSVSLKETLGHVAYELGREKEALRWYESVLAEKQDPEIMNNVAWILVTAKDKRLRDPLRGLKLALKATAEKLCATHLDTLAEAWWINQRPEKACLYGVLALDRAKTAPDYYLDLDYFQRQEEKFCHVARKPQALR